MEKETKKAMIIISIISFAFALGFSIYFNYLFSSSMSAYLDNYVKNIESGSGSYSGYHAMKSVCDFDISDSSFTCINASGNDIDCSKVKENDDIRFMGPISLNQCYKSKLDGMFDNFRDINHKSQMQYIGLSNQYAADNMVKYYRSSLYAIYSRELFFSTNKIAADTLGLFLIVVHMGSAWIQITTTLHYCGSVYNNSQKSAECTNSMLQGWDSSSSEILNSIAFDQDWIASCSKRLAEEFRKGASIGLLQSWNVPYFNTGEICSRIGPIYNEMLLSAKNRQQNPAEKMFTAITLYNLNKYAERDTQPREIAEIITKTLGPEYKEVKEEIVARAG